MKLIKLPLIGLFAFIAASVLAAQINFTPVLIGEKLNFTFFDLYGPIAGGLFGPLVSAAAVFIVEAAGLVLNQTFSLAGVLHLFPILFGTWYFGSNKKLIALIPLVAMVYFVVNPTSRAAWYYSLFWLIPILSTAFKEESLIARSLGATFTTHAAGGLLWVYFFNPPAQVWIDLIPIVAMERLVFTLTSAIMYLILQKAHAIYTNQNPGPLAAQR